MVGAEADLEVDGRPHQGSPALAPLHQRLPVTAIARVRMGTSGCFKVSTIADERGLTYDDYDLEFTLT